MIVSPVLVGPVGQQPDDDGQASFRFTAGSGSELAISFCGTWGR